jgi:hypothetical protein
MLCEFTSEHILTSKVNSQKILNVFTIELASFMHVFTHELTHKVALKPLESSNNKRNQITTSMKPTAL